MNDTFDEMRKRLSMFASQHSATGRLDDESFSRESPSPRYLELLGLYERIHREGISDRKDAGNIFAGGSLRPHLQDVRDLVKRSGAKSLLDYGSGKGVLYRQRDIELSDGEIIPSVAEYLQVASIACFDPGVPQFSQLPEGQFDGVVSTDVLEHCPEQDIPWILDEMFGKARKFVFANVASYPAAKVLPNGENAHCTQNSPAWWEEVLRKISAKYPGILYRFDVTQKRRGLLNKLFGRRWIVTAIVNYA